VSLCVFSAASVVNYDTENASATPRTYLKETAFKNDKS
jgi:hypothetical protein